MIISALRLSPTLHRYDGQYEIKRYVNTDGEIMNYGMTIIRKDSCNYGYMFCGLSKEAFVSLLFPTRVV
jgi:hypothetical protein